LTKQQWKNLKIFLQKTRTQKRFPKDTQGFSSCNVIKNEVYYYSLKREIRISDSIKKKSQKAKERARLLRESQDVMKYRMVKKISIDFNDFHITLTRTKFNNFREAILKTNLKSLAM